MPTFNNTCTFVCFQEREARLDFMKKRARERDGVSSDEEDKSSNDKPSSSATPKNINLFSDLEQGVSVNGWRAFNYWVHSVQKCALSYEYMFCVTFHGHYVML